MIITKSYYFNTNIVLYFHFLPRPLSSSTFSEALYKHFVDKMIENMTMNMTINVIFTHQFSTVMVYTFLSILYLRQGHGLNLGLGSGGERVHRASCYLGRNGPVAEWREEWTLCELEAFFQHSKLPSYLTLKQIQIQHIM